MGRWEGGKVGRLNIVSVYVHCKTHRKRTDIEMNETLNLHRQRTKWTADIELDNNKSYWKLEAKKTTFGYLITDYLF